MEILNLLYFGKLEILNLFFGQIFYFLENWKFPNFWKIGNFKFVFWTNFKISNFWKIGNFLIFEKLGLLNLLIFGKSEILNLLFFGKF